MPVLTRTKKDIEIDRKTRLDLLEKAEEACRWLLGLGAKKTFVFGSVLRDDGFRRRTSDIDIAVRGLPERFVYRVESRIEDILGGHEFDLVYMEDAPGYLVKKIEREGKRI
jgi:predicted nucleotidyltransferase